MRWNPGDRVSLSHAGRTLTLVVLLLALWNPQLPWNDTPLDLILLLDDSASMTRERSNQAWREIVSLGAKLPDGSRFSLIRFAADSVQEIDLLGTGESEFQRHLESKAPPRTQRLGLNQTNIEQALRTTISRIPLGRDGVIVLATDGNQTLGNLEQSLEFIHNQSIALLWWRPTKSTNGIDAWIQSLVLPHHAAAGQTIPVVAQIGSFSQIRGNLQLITGDTTLLERELTLEPDTLALVSGQIELPGAGTHLVKAVIDAQDDFRPQNNTRSDIVQINGPARVLYLGNLGEQSPMSASLRQGGWPVTTVLPAEFEPDLVRDHDLLILEDLPFPALTDEAWRRIGNAVTHQGRGMIVLGGPNTFGGGGYRGSRLEQLLPVTAESAHPLSPAAVLFVLDKSGSMGRGKEPGTISRMAVARQAVEDSLGFLEQGDLSGLLTFDIEAQVHLPLRRYQDPRKRFGGVWTFSPRGGTRLAPALTKALDLLAETNAEQKLIVLVTDGFVEQDDAFDEIEQSLLDADVDLIALPIGREPATALLQRLTSLNQGRLLPVDDILRLPQLMRNEVMKRRSAMESGRFFPRQTADLQFLPPESTVWPPLDAYMVSKKRPRALTHLVSEKGDPLLASHYAGTGRVVALPAGLDRWATAWHGWQKWGLFLGGLVEWTAGNRPNPRIHIGHRELSDKISLEVDALDDEHAWNESAILLARILDPGGRARDLHLPQVAPGRYQSSFRAGLPGVYNIQVRKGEDSARYALYHEPTSEFRADKQYGSALEVAVQRGDILPWQGVDPLAATGREKGTATIWVPLLVLSLITYLSTLLLERVQYSGRV